MDITLNELESTPIMRAARAQAEQAKADKMRAEQAAEAEAATRRHREESLAKIKQDIEHDAALYQAHRLAVRKCLARLHESELRYKSTLGIDSIHAAPVVPVQLKKAHLPTAFPRPSDALYPLFSTAEEDSATYAATRRWPAELGDIYEE